MDRYLRKLIRDDLDNKIILLSGPRQCGKTTLSKNLDISYDYLNMDNEDHVVKLKNKFWDRNKDLLILDEFHKIKNWKKFIKGVYDTEGIRPRILITGSAKLDSFKNVGDSLAGRYFNYKLFPLDIKEAVDILKIPAEDAFEKITSYSGFPEPFLKAEKSYYKRWFKTHNEIILTQDLIDLAAVKEIKTIKILSTLLRQRIGGCVNYTNLAKDLQVSPVTVKNWIEILENIYLFFKITPYNKNIARSLLKEPKIYCYDIASIDDEAQKLENLVALSLLKRLAYLEDTLGCNVALHYLRTKDGKEIDFLAKVDDKKYMIEVKTSDDNISPNFMHFDKFMEKSQSYQLVKNLKIEYSDTNGTMVCNLVNWLAEIDNYII